MSRIDDLGSNYENLVDLIDEYEIMLEKVPEQLKMEGKTLDEANRENPDHQLFYSYRRSELRILVKHFEGEVKRVTAKLYKSCKENQGRNIELNERELTKWIENEPALRTPKRLLLEVQEIHDKFEATVDAFTARGYALNNITKARVAEIGFIPI